MTTKHVPPRRRARHTLSLLGLSAALFGCAGAASAVPPTILYVSPTGSDTNPGTQASPFLTIQAAITASNNGGTIDIADGTYTGPGNVDLDTGGTNLTIQSDHGAASTIIDCGGSSGTNHRGFYMHYDETVTLRGLTIKNGYESGTFSGGAVEILNNISLTTVIIEDCSFQDNSGLAAVVSEPSNSSAKIVMRHSKISGGQGGVASYGDMTLEGCQIDNAATNGVSAFGVNSGGSAAVTNCVITNSGQSGLYNSCPSFTGANCTLSGNASGVIADAYFITLTNFIVRGPYAVYPINGNSVSAINSDLAGPVAPGLTLTNCIDADPLFVSTTDFHLQSTSPALGAGTSTGAPATDLDGTTRPTSPSMGAYEAAAVQAATVTSITITPAVPSVTVGSTQQLTATANFSDSTTSDVTAQTTWTSSNPAVVSIDSNGLATGHAAGTVSVTATYNGVTSAPATLTASAPVTLPAASSYQALWGKSDGGFSVWDVALGGGFAPHDFDATPGFDAQAIADTPDGHVHVLLTAASGAVQFDDAVIASLARQHNASTQLSYGPFNGWTAHSIAAGPDGVLRVLWTRTDGQISLWKLYANGTYTHAEYGPYAGWTARLMAVAHDNTVRIVWTKTDGQMSFWVMNAQGGYAHAEYGAYPGWTPTALTTSAAGQNLVSWTHAADGKLSLWALQDSGQFTFVNFGPFAGWTASSLTVGADSTLHVGWTQPNGLASLWDLSGTGYQFSVYGPYSTWHLQGLAAAP